MQKQRPFGVIFAGTLLYCFSAHSMEFPTHPPFPDQAPALSPYPIFPPISTHHDKPILGFKIKDLEQLAPIAMTMYCFNQAPRFTMICLSIMLIYVITEKEYFKKSKLKAIQKIKKLCRKKQILFYCFFSIIAAAQFIPLSGTNLSLRAPE